MPIQKPPKSPEGGLIHHTNKAPSVWLGGFIKQENGTITYQKSINV